MNFKNFYSRSSLDNWFGDSFVRGNSYMKADIYEKDDICIIEIDMPGYNKKDIHIGYVNGSININAGKDAKDDDKNYIQKERYFGEYSRSFYVGNIDENQIKATFENGILQIKFPKNLITNDVRKYINID